MTDQLTDPKPSGSTAIRRVRAPMLTDLALRNLKPRPTRYKVTDRDGMYVVVYPTGAISLRYDYRLNGRRETFVIGRNHPGG